MIEVLKQAAEDVSKAYDVLAFAHTERALELLAKTRTSLRQAITELESQEPLAWMREDGQRVTTASYRHNYPDYETRYSIPLYTHPPQRKCENCGEFGTCCLKTESQERNFCPRCGKRTNYIHTCTPPQENT